MKHGFIKVAAATPKIKVADCDYNAREIIKLMEQAEKEQVRLLVLPELCLTGYTCGDLFLQNTLINGAADGLKLIIDASSNKSMLVIAGLPMVRQHKLYNVAAVICSGELLGFVPKRYLPNYCEFYEARHFQPGNREAEYVEFDGKKIPFGSQLLFQNKELPDFITGVEICEDLWVACPPSGGLSLAGATVICNPSASDDATGKDSYRKELVKNQSARLNCAYLYASAGDGESTTDLVFSGHNMIAENGIMLKEDKRFDGHMVVTEIDLEKLVGERKKKSTFLCDASGYTTVTYSFADLEGKSLPETKLTRPVDPAPFVPGKVSDRKTRCEEITNIQARGLKKRLEHIGCKNVVVGISGGLDSTLALLVTVRAYDLLNLPHEGIIAVTMPCFGTTDRTYQNAMSLMKELKVTIREIPLKDAVTLHFKDIGHDEDIHDITYENSQARERTQILMDLANQYNGIVIGTGDMSELALGWATYNGDHMSMYGVNCSVPKTLVRYLVSYFADQTQNKKLKEVLEDVLDTPVSPELIPPKEGEIVQKTEDIVGPYELHDFFLFYVLRLGYSPEKIYRLAKIAFAGTYSEETILKWEKTFYRRFFSQQFKRSCLPDGPKVGSVALSPRGDLRMPSDASAALWTKELNSL